MLLVRGAISGGEISVTEEIMQAAASSDSVPTMELLLDRQGEDVKITKLVLKIAAIRSFEMKKLLFDRSRGRINVTEGIVQAVASNGAICTLEILLDRHGQDLIITEKLLEKAGRNTMPKCFGLLLDRRGEDVNVTKKS